MHYQNRSTVKGKARYKGPKPLGGVIENVVRSLGISNSYHGWLVVSKWPEIVGEHIAHATKAVRFEDGTLFVAVPDASWRQELAMQIDEIMQKIRSYPFGRAVTQVRFVQGEKGL
ncbi:MAG TPA: DUF721 domain-containing protein [Candidatus Deferrimicrobium sp.]|nr:DUF721 domain-containing protein [Candidatus Deferrimicrobium sp.]